jgi:general secretion pathway protein J
VRRRGRGFTLIEMLVALALVSLMSVAMIDAYRFSQRTFVQTTRVDAAVHDVAAAQRLLRRVIEQAYPFESTGGDARGAAHGLNGESTVFEVSAPAPAQAGGLGFHRYRIALNAEGALEVQWGLDRNGTAAPQGAQSRSEAILRGIESLRVEYLELIERGNGQIEPQWHETWIDKAAPPALVRIRVKFPEGDRRFWPELIVAPRISTDANCVFDVVSQMCRMAS